jgi:hypothetical protein
VIFRIVLWTLSSSFVDILAEAGVELAPHRWPGHPARAPR